MFNKEYKKKVVSAEAAIARIKDGDSVFVGHAVGEASHILDVMCENYKKFKDIEIIHMVGMGKQTYTKEMYKGHFRYNSLFVNGFAREGIKNGNIDFTPVYFYNIPGYIRNGGLKCDVFMMQVSPPDKNGYCSMGVSVDYGVAASKTAKIIIAEVNENMPRTHGESFIHISDIDCFVESNHPLIELTPAPLSDIDKQIGRNIAKLIDDGATLQLGIGALPDAVLLSLSDKNDLGIHSEMISDGAIELMDKGIINNKQKTLHPDKSVVTFVMGTRRLYDYIDDNPSFSFLPVDYVNDPYVIRQNDNMVSINSAVQVDLIGQVCSESVGPYQISSVGGQVDFVRGANMAKNGKSIIAMHSTAKKGQISKIVPFLAEGSTVTTNKYDVGYIATEYGVAKLKGKSQRDRTRALIEIAHPDFRDQMKEHYKEIYKENY